MLKICHLYPEVLNLYGDSGNVVAFQKRCLWRNIPYTTDRVKLGENVDFSRYHMVFIGGGPERGQGLITTELLKRRDNIKKSIENGLVVLAICGGYQLLGKYFQNIKKERIDGLNILDFYSLAGEKRLVGNIVIEVELESSPYHAVGFENHVNQTYLGDINPFGKVLAGQGNNNEDNWEGARYKNVFCTYLHGPLLPKNPCLTDTLISLAVQKSSRSYVIKPLLDTYEDKARTLILRRMNIKS